VRTATRPPASVDLSAENLFSSSTLTRTFHEISSHLSCLLRNLGSQPHRPRAQSAKLQVVLVTGLLVRTLDCQCSIRGFTPSTHFGPLDITFTITLSPSEVSVDPKKRHSHPKISLSITSTLDSSPLSTPTNPLPSILRNTHLMSIHLDAQFKWIHHLRRDPPRLSPSKLLITSKHSLGMSRVSQRACADSATIYNGQARPRKEQRRSSGQTTGPSEPRCNIPHPRSDPIYGVNPRPRTPSASHLSWRQCVHG
jgi:hypothetical protein